MIEPNSTRRPPRVIHIVESLDSGAVENWLMRMLRASHLFAAPVDWTFYTVLQRPGKFDDEARQLGATVINSPVALDDKIAFVRALRRTLRAGHYDVMHCHHDVVSAVYLVAAIGLGIPRTIVHVHNADLHVPTGSTRKSALLREPMRQICLRLADRIVGISKHTLENFVQGSPKAIRDHVLYYGVYVSPFHDDADWLDTLRDSLKIPDGARMLLFAGRMVSYKNPLFVLDVLASVAAQEPQLYALFAGTGPLESELSNRARELGIADRIRVLGWRDDTVSLMQLSDIFIFPRVEAETADVGKEGLGLVVVEAQAAGMRLLLSRAIPEDAIIVAEQCETLTLEAGTAAWGDAVRRMLALPRPDRAVSLAALARSPFALETGFRNLIALHDLRAS